MNTIEELLQRILELSEKASPAPWDGGPIERIGGGTLYDKTVAIASFHWDNECDRKEIGSIHRFRTEEECNANLALVTAFRNLLTPSRIRALIGAVKALEEMTEHYVSLVNSGDAGNWNPEEDPQVIAARLALSALNTQTK